MNRYIEVCVRDEVSTTERGRVLERFARRFLETQNYDVVNEVRITGMEVDLLADERTTGERIIVECKAQRSTIAADVLTKLYGKVGLEDFSSGWLISTYELGKDAKGIRDRWAQKPPEERRRLQVYDPQSLIDRLVKAGFLFDPSRLRRPDVPKLADELYLLLAQDKTYWALIGVDEQTLIRRAVYVYDAHTGERVTAKAVLASLAATDSSMATLVWEAEDNADRSREAQRLKQELQSVVRVQSGDHWADYRPARPQDYVGREDLQKDVLDLFEKVRTRATRTRVFAIKGPSGWGKSSSVLKIADRAGSRKPKVFVYAVDSRAASSRRFVELALYRALLESIEQGFVRTPGTLSIGGPNAPLSTGSIGAIFAQLRRERKAICLIFDQFEELLYKEELSPIFDDVRMLCDSAIEAGEGLIIGFSWKTDGAVPPEHNAYHLWHSLADRRREFELNLFSSGEVTIAINRFMKELGQAISPQLRRLLWDHCQGYPWLLKKLCIHILEQVRNGLDQSEILVRTLRIEELFSRDIERLSASELACTRQVASEAPAEFFKIVGIYGDVTITSLLDKRLIIRTGSRLNVYWDIFRDYILTEKVPYIPTTYIPQLNVVTYLSALRNLISSTEMSYRELAKVLNITAGTADNLVRDMVIVGHAEANRKTGSVIALHLNVEDAAKCLIGFCRSHALYRAVLERFGVEEGFSLSDVVRVAAEIYSRLRLSAAVLEQYARRAMQWCVAAGLIDRVGEDYFASGASHGVSGLTAGGSRNRRGRGFFLGDAPPERVVAAIAALATERLNREELRLRHGNKAFEALCALGIADNRGALLTTIDDTPASLARHAARANPALHAMRRIIEREPNVAGSELGAALAVELSATWTEASCDRFGNALRRWVGWTWPDEFEWRGVGQHRRLFPKVAGDAQGALI
ncbi:restriction endonuclease [Plastoroseomonas hellenica]|uniref:restriction endonuclease n=1 Tax=Plastoroseomonas hellenica TaxID=2687306 RepID=UPI001BAE4B00|nr:restriction endonuclease [Plastoroseomonas hellenica]MBR0646890.1 hypothetical protein [Plastoroseomonas hellenica]